MALDPATSARIKQVFEKQRQHRWVVSKRGVAERIATLKKLREAVIARRGEIAQAIHQDLRRSASESEVIEIHPTIEEINHAIHNLPDWMDARSVPTPLTLAGTRSEVRCEAKGVVLILSPWNYPVFLLAPPLAAALAAGNCVVLKPSEKCPASSKAMADLIRATFDESEVAIFEGGPEVAEALLDLPFDHLFFTGSTKIGRKVMAAAAKTLASVTLELGGKSPAYVDPSCDLDATAERLAWGRFANAGQTCVAPDYVWVHESLERPLVDRLRSKIEKFYGKSDEERQKSTDFARLIDDAAFKRLKDLVDRSVAKGAKIDVGGKFDAGERYIAPTVLSGVTTEQPIMEDEIFGPILPILTYKSLAETFPFVERKGKPLALYIFARSRKVVDEIFANTSAGGTVVNNVLIHLANPNLPFGGVGTSGLGSYHGAAGFKAFSHERAVLKQGMPALSRFLEPPYAESMKALTIRLIKALE
jgi:aldehyde dehydrogenase (NAD+)